jgi:hypothetical protein
MSNNKWVEFVKKWAKKHKQTYMCAASKQKCRDEYHAANPKNKTQKRKLGSAISRNTRKNKTRVQRELLKKYKAYAKYKKAKGQPLE